MKEIDIVEGKQIQLAILKNVALFCEKNNIRYFLCGGTLLGAVRHNGYIPWDDDIDIAMPRPDYERFLNTFKDEYCKLLRWSKGSKCLCPFAKVYDSRTFLEEPSNWQEELGVNIDVFPIDGLPGSDKKIKKTVQIAKLLFGLVVCATIKNISQRRPIKKLEIIIMRVVYKIFPLKVTEYTITHATKYEFDTSNMVACLVWGYGVKEVMPKEVATEYIKGKFEDAQFNIPKDYNIYLTNLYGNYMKLPSESCRVYKHSAKMWWK